jgi:methionine-rich copper-binding protein CopC
MSIFRASLSHPSYAIEDIDPPFDLSAVHMQQGGRVVMGSISGAPTLVSATPADNSGAVAVGANIVLTFSNTVIAGSGTIRIGDGYLQNYIDKSGHQLTRWVGATDSHSVSLSDTSQVTISGNTVTINLSDDLKAGLNYSVTMAPGVLKDLSNRPYSGLADSSKLNFTTDASGAAQISGSLHFEDSGASSTDYITNSAAQTVSGTYSGTLGSDHVEVSIDNGGHWHTASNAANGSWSYSGFDPVTASSTILARVVDSGNAVRNTVSHSFVFDNTTPTLDSSSPANHAINVNTSTITLTFNEDVDLRPSAFLHLIGGNDDFALGVESGEISVNGHTVTLTLPQALMTGTSYTLSMDGASYLTDIAGNAVFGPDATVLDFSTMALGQPGAPTMFFVETQSATDPGGETTDGVTSHLAVNVGSLGGGNTWSYNLNDNTGWHAGSGDGFNLPNSDHVYAIGEIEIKQTDTNSVDSEVTSNTSAVTIDVTVAAHVEPTSTSAFSTNPSQQTITGTFTYTGAVNDGFIEVSFDDGGNWTRATSGVITAGVNSWSVDGSPDRPIWVRISDAAGNLNGVDGHGTTAAVVGSGGSDSFSIEADAVVFGQNGDDTFTLDTQSFSLVAGGAGSDTLAFSSNHETFVLQNFGATKLTGIDVIALGANQHNTLTISDATRLNTATDGNAGEYTLTITGDSTDTLDLTGTDFYLYQTLSGFNYFENGQHQHLIVTVGVQYTGNISGP